MGYKTYKIYTLGCKVNQYDSLQLKRKLDGVGLRLADNNVDIAIINTCAVTATAINKSRRALNLARKESPRVSIALIGCWPAINEKRNQDFPPEADNIDFIYGANEADKLVSAISNKNKTCAKAPLVFDKSRARYTIKIQDGCEQYCSYCIIPFTRGKLRSRLKKEILEEISEAVDCGYREIVLSGIHLGLYGKEKTTDRRPARNVSAARRARQQTADLISLMKEIIKIKNIGRIRLSSIEVNEVSDEIIELIKTSGKVCKHLHVPLQSGCDKILKLMNRPYTQEQFRNKIKKIRKAAPKVAISTDVIVGFPGENERDFEETVKFIKEIGFSRLHVFPFSAHSKTPASKLPNQLDEKIKIKRAKKLRALGEQFKNKYQKQFKGKDLNFIIEREKDNYYIGKSEYYFDCKILKRIIKPDKLKIGAIYSFKF
ncbi:MiaB/RimO family radical SAM methylthiotransferase [Candidatus Parcubacteria bacterium]|nr:MiaB/RimO family radical SAM methylthiotransferase [Candidatus Parcubacteria bacterium]